MSLAIGKTFELFTKTERTLDKLARQIQIHTFLLSENQEMNHELYLPRSSTHSGEVGWFKCESINKLVTRPHEDLQ